MGKSCVRVKKIEDVPLDVLGRAIKRATLKRFVASYEAGLAGTKAGQAARKKASAAKKPTTKKAATKKASKKKAVAKKPAAKARTKKA